ncbi:hypothetical protein [Micromonospora okii]|uniref:hypothetical protein n=1 Tax=Micromonospora okii TaxID=1182970 RepID=UPI001E5A8518|nr:hypothetical protein [Micromonospora okii]
MGKHRRPCDDAATTGEAGAAYWSVHDDGWPALRPTLPAELVDLLAPPIVVGVARTPAAARPHTAAPGPAAPRPGPPAASRPAAPAAPRPAVSAVPPPSPAGAPRPIPQHGPFQLVDGARGPLRGVTGRR